MSAIFLSHGSPDLALQKNSYTESLKKYFQKNPPKACVFLSAHWCTGNSLEITAAEHPGIECDFYGFSPELYQLEYSMRSSKELLQEVQELLRQFHPKLNYERNFDHGVWMPLRIAFPQLPFPVIQISLPLSWDHKAMMLLGASLKLLREKGIAIVGSGGAVHNLRRLDWKGLQLPPEDWALGFNNWLRSCVEERKFKELVHFDTQAPQWTLAHPTLEHLYPLFFVLGAVDDSDRYEEIVDEFMMRNLSLYSFSFQQ